MRVPPALVLALAALGCAELGAAPLPPEARSEVTALFSQLQASGCQFNRNGSWHWSAEAQSHLTRKLEYLEGKNLVRTTEDFIDLGASASSSSGKPYLVKCGAMPSVESKAWLLQHLKTMRQAKSR